MDLAFWHWKDLEKKIFIIKDTHSYCWERQSPVHSLSTPTQSHENEPSAWNTSLPGDKAPTTMGLGLSPCMGISFFVSGTVSTLLSLFQVCAAYGT